MDAVHAAVQYTGEAASPKWYVPLSDKEKKKITRELVQTVLARKPKMCSFLEVERPQGGCLQEVSHQGETRRGLVADGVYVTRGDGSLCWTCQVSTEARVGDPSERTEGHPHRRIPRTDSLWGQRAADLQRDGRGRADPPPTTPGRWRTKEVWRRGPPCMELPSSRGVDAISESRR
ncbi:hypothetical protein J4Q44_G00150730 [Coregonus suidteri]|uniref:AP complex mu/sigma subunit domain-containing protein n=1 Tax=Coregonus suidteri TaxID=861788 RepID=A0AAN8LPL5_9TELE